MHAKECSHACPAVADSSASVHVDVKSQLLHRTVIWVCAVQALSGYISLP